MTKFKKQKIFYEIYKLAFFKLVTRKTKSWKSF